MAGRGPAPKAPGQRRRRNEPGRGEWTDLEPLAKPVLRVASKEWPEHVRVLWAEWRSDPVTAVWSSSSRAWAWATAARWDDFAPAEQRLRADGLGLTEKGRRDLRLRLPNEIEAGGGRPQLAEVHRLRAVDTSA